MKINSKVILYFIICHLISYVVISIPFYHFIMRDYYKGSEAVFSRFLITEESPILWANAIQWFFPFQILNSTLFAIVLVIVWDWFSKQSYFKGFLFVFWCKGIVGGLASLSPAPGNIEGALFLIPQINSQIQLFVCLETLLQAAMVSFLFCNVAHWKLISK